VPPAGRAEVGGQQDAARPQYPEYLAERGRPLRFGDGVGGQRGGHHVERPVRQAQVLGGADPE
jgi:hypothetical protein